jgi:translation initiation factor IF-1
MQRFELIEVRGTVTEFLGGSLCRVKLANGHVLLGHFEESLEARLTSGEIQCLPDSVVLLQLRAFDLSTGLIVGVQPFVSQ